jgi:protein-tyrosine phosphatase
MFFSRKTVDLSWIQTDMHSHLIPGIDDGSPDMDTSLEMIIGLRSLGFKKLITTPHILWEMYPNTPEKINEGLKQLQHVANEKGIQVTLKAAAEYFIDEYFEQQLKSKTSFLTINDNKILVEYSMVTAPMDLQKILFELEIQNYQPIIAHPERYIYLLQNRDFFDDLKASGCMFQLNLLSLTGYYGDTVQDLSEYLVRKEYYDYAGTDLHNPRQLAALQKLSSSSLLKKLRDSGTIKNHEL